MKSIRRLFMFLCCATLLCAACAPSALASEAPLSIVCTIFPAYDFARQLAGDTAQDHVLLDALLGRLAVGDGIACAAVQQSVIAARGARGDVAAFEQQRANPAQRAVAGHAGARRAAADNNHIELLCHGIFVFDSFPFAKERIKRNISK